MRRAVLGLMGAVALQACALLSRHEVMALRTYTPEDAPGLAVVPRSAGVGSALRLGRVTSADSLDRRVMRREGPHEVAYLEDREWTERPEAYLRRALARTLFEEGRLGGVVGGAAPALDVELLAFEEVRAPAWVGRVTLSLSVGDERGVSLQQTLSCERKVVVRGAEGEGSAVARALGEALRDAVDEVSRRTRP